jgi:ubiquinone/menaquinone biosynthesis C-methylase UbiE
MGLDWWWILVIAGIVLALLFPFLAGLPRVAINRHPEAEGFDDVSTGIGYAEIQERLEFKSMRQTVVNHLLSTIKNGSITTPLDVLDLGCGTGHLINDIHAEFERRKIPVRLHGIDIGAASIRECKALLARKGLQEVDIKEGDGARMPVQDDSIDIVVTSLSLHHWSKPEAVFGDIHRVLKPGGRLVLFDLRRDARKFYHHAFNHWFTPRMPEPLKSAGDPYRSMLSAYTPREVEEILDRTPWKGEERYMIPRSIAIIFDGIKHG